MNSVDIKLSKELKNGIEFSCFTCGGCCRGFEEGEVYIYMKDITRLADHLNFKGKSGLRKFAKKYLKIIEDTCFWKEPGAKKGRKYKFQTLGFRFFGEDDHCDFLNENNMCGVHEYRPFQCRAFPFWQMMVTSHKNFVDYSEKCSGLRKLKGKFYSSKEILNWAKDEREMEKEYFLEMKRNNFDIYKVYNFLPKDMTC